jgi:hypothetical protein
MSKKANMAVRDNGTNRKTARNPQLPSLDSVGADDKLHVIAWEGWERENLYRRRLASGRKLTEHLDFLLYIRAPAIIPKLFKPGKRYYDVLVADAEYIRRYADAGRLAHTEPKLNAQWDRVADFIRKKVEDHVIVDSKRFAIPCRWGFQEILVRREAAKEVGITERTKYSELKIEDILEHTDWKIGLWNWSLPSLCIILATNDVPLENAHKQTYNGILECLRPIVKVKDEWKRRVRFFDTIEDIHSKIRSDGIKIVYGAGSWALPQDFKVPMINITPAAGVLMWTECAAILQDTANIAPASMARAAGLIDHWLSVNTQKILRVSDPSSSLPANEEVLKATYEDRKFHHPALSTLRTLFDKDLQPTGKIVARTLPSGPIQLEWEDAWAWFRNLMGTR